MPGHRPARVSDCSDDGRSSICSWPSGAASSGRAPPAFPCPRRLLLPLPVWLLWLLGAGCGDGTSKPDAGSRDGAAVDGGHRDLAGERGRADAPGREKLPADGKRRDPAAADTWASERPAGDGMGGDSAAADAPSADRARGDAARRDGSAADGVAGAATVIFAERLGGPFGRYQVFAMRPDGSGARQLTDTPGSDNDEPTISPDGTLVGFASGRDFAPADGGGGAASPMLRMIYLMAIDGQGPRRLTGNPAGQCSEHNPRFSNDSAWVTFDMACSNLPPANFSRVYRIRVDGRDQQAYAPSHPELRPDSNHLRPVFSRDDRRLVFVGPVDSLFADLFSVNVDGSDLQRLTRCSNQQRSVALQAAMPARGSDLVYFVSHRDPSAGDQQARLEAIRMDGSGQQLVAMIPSLTAPADLAGAPRFRDFALSPAADQVVFVSYEDPSATPPTYAIVVSTLACSCLAKIRFAGDYRGPFWR